MEVLPIASFVVVAVGAITTIAIYLDRKWSTKRKLKVRIRHGFSPSDQSKFIMVSVSNPSPTSSTITSVSIGSGKDLIYFPAESVRGYEKLPLKLESGESHDFLYDYEIIKKSLKDHGQNILDALCNDALGNRYDAKTFKVKLD